MKHKKQLPAIIICIVLATFGCNQQAEKASETDLVSTRIEPTVAGKSLDKKQIVGTWTRTDAPYQLKIEDLFENGNLKAGYFNPKSIYVGKGTWNIAKGFITINVELRDDNYPGSNYILTYIPGKDILSGKYYRRSKGLHMKWNLPGRLIKNNPLNSITIKKRTHSIHLL